jgi:hypothetical protein
MQYPHIDHVCLRKLQRLEGGKWKDVNSVVSGRQSDQNGHVLVIGASRSSTFGSCENISLAFSKMYMACVSLNRPSAWKCRRRNATFGLLFP